MSKNDVFQILYDGPALISHEMNVRDLAPALLSMAQILEDSNKLLNGDRVKVSVNLKATNEGSVEITLSVVQSLIDQANSLFNGDEVNSVINATELLNLLGIIGGGGVIGVIKWLKGRDVKKVTTLKDGAFQLEVDGNNEVKVVSQQELKLFGLVSVRKGFEAVIKKTLKSNGITRVGFLKDGKETVAVTENEADYFSSPNIEDEILGESESETNLQIVSITFQEGGKWKFSDGNAAFFADILDENFITKVQQNQASFSKDDILKVSLKRKQSLNADGGIKTDYTIAKVLEHRSAAVQIKLPFEKN